MGRRKEPVELIEAKGKTHLTKAEKDRRRRSEPKSSDTAIMCPDYITDLDDRLEFVRYAEMLDNIGIWSELHADELARYITSEKVFEELSKHLRYALSAGDIEDAAEVQKMQDKAYRQAHTSASSLGLNITSFCKLVVPKVAQDDPIDF